MKVRVNFGGQSAGQKEEALEPLARRAELQGCDLNDRCGRDRHISARLRLRDITGGHVRHDHDAPFRAPNDPANRPADEYPRLHIGRDLLPPRRAPVGILPFDVDELILWHGLLHPARWRIVKPACVAAGTVRTFPS